MEIGLVYDGEIHINRGGQGSFHQGFELHGGCPRGERYFAEIEPTVLAPESGEGEGLLIYT